MARKLVSKIMKNQTQPRSKRIALAILAKSAFAYSILLNGKNQLRKLKHKLRR